MQKKISVGSDDKNELIQAVKLRLNQDTCLVAIYTGPQTSGKNMKNALTNL